MLDQTITSWLNSPAGRYPLLDSAAIGITTVGVPLLILLVVVQWWSKSDPMHVRHACIAAGLSFLLGLGINQIIRLFLHRIRPYDAGISHLIIPPSADWSFPSDHANASVAIVAAFFLQGLRRRALLLGASTLAICWSRVFLGTHYVTDILGGVLTGVAAATLIAKTYREGTGLDRLMTSIL